MELELPLKIAGKLQEPKEREYFDEFVEPHLGIHGIEYLGESRTARRSNCSRTRGRRSSRSTGKSRSAW